MTPNPRLLPYLAGTAMLALAVAGCDGDSHSSTLLRDTPVAAADGGTFTSDDGVLSVTVPAGALDEDAVLTVRRLDDDFPTGVLPASAHLEFQSDPYQVVLRAADGGMLGLNAPLKLAIRSAGRPTHPVLGELVETGGGNAERLPSFYRDSEQRAVALTERLEGTYRVRFRSLQTEGGEAVERGQTVFVDETFGNEGFFGDFLGLHVRLSGIDPDTGETVLDAEGEPIGLTPAEAVQLGVQVDINKVPQPIVDVMTGDDLAAKTAALTDPATTVALVRADAVIGVKGFFQGANPDRMTSAGITCALCHITVEPTEFTLDVEGTPTPVELPIGVAQIDGVPNAALDAGAILAKTPTALAAGLDGVLGGWGPGRFDVRALDIEGVDRNPLEDNVINPTAYPPIWNFVDLQEQDYRIGWDGLFQGENALASISEAVYDLIFHGNGAFGVPPGAVDVEGAANGTILPPALAITPPEALVAGLLESERERPGNDIVPPQKLFDIQAFMGSIASPAPMEFDAAQAETGFELFHGGANCSSCHATAEFTGPGRFVITVPAPEGDLAEGIKVAGLRGVAHTAPFFHDASAATLADVVSHYADNVEAVPALTEAQQAALVEYLKSL